MTFVGICGKISIAYSLQMTFIQQKGTEYAENIGFDFGGNKKGV